MLQRGPHNKPCTALLKPRKKTGLSQSVSAAFYKLYKRKITEDMILQENKWIIIRISILIFFIITGYSMQMKAEVNVGFSLQDIISFSVFILIASFLVIQPQIFFSKKKNLLWKKPNWRDNFILKNQPLLFFHFGGYFFISGGFGFLLYSIVNKLPLLSVGLFFILSGLCTLLNVKIAQLIYRNNIE